MILPYISGPLLGAIIGYITNDIAIRMLFRPRTAKYIMGKRVPFTPGIIPKEKNRIAGAIGGAISENLMNKEVLEKTLLSDEMLEKLRNAVDEFFNTQMHNEESLLSYATRQLEPTLLMQRLSMSSTRLVLVLWEKSRPTVCLRLFPRL